MMLPKASRMTITERLRLFFIVEQVGEADDAAVSVEVVRHDRQRVVRPGVRPVAERDEGEGECAPGTLRYLKAPEPPGVRVERRVKSGRGVRRGYGRRLSDPSTFYYLGRCRPASA